MWPMALLAINLASHYQPNILLRWSDSGCYNLPSSTMATTTSHPVTPCIHTGSTLISCPAAAEPVSPVLSYREEWLTSNWSSNIFRTLTVWSSLGNNWHELHYHTSGAHPLSMHPNVQLLGINCWHLIGWLIWQKQVIILLYLTSHKLRVHVSSMHTIILWYGWLDLWIPY